VTLQSGLAFHLVMAVDIQGYSRRSAKQQQSAQTELCRVLDSAAAAAALDRARWDRQIGGDGELSLLPCDVDVAQVIRDFTGGMGSALAALNRPRTSRRLRVRLAFHYGTAAPGLLGATGKAPIVTRRLVDADAGREHLRNHPEHNLAVIVSAPLFHEVVETGFCDPMDPEDFEPVHEVIKDDAYDGYLYRKQHGTDLASAPERLRHGRRVRTGTRIAWDVAFRHRSTPSSN
jgi:class 3 adenylate cyclase